MCDTTAATEGAFGWSLYDIHALTVVSVIIYDFHQGREAVHAQIDAGWTNHGHDNYLLPAALRRLWMPCLHIGAHNTCCMILSFAVRARSYPQGPAYLFWVHNTCRIFFFSFVVWHTQNKNK